MSEDVNRQNEINRQMCNEMMRAMQDSSDWASVYEKYHNTFNYTRTWGLNEKSSDLPIKTDDRVKPLPCKRCGEQPKVFEHIEPGSVSCSNKSCWSWMFTSPNIKHWNRKNTPSRLAGAVTRFFNRWKLRAKYCCSLPWSGVKAAAHKVWYKRLSCKTANAMFGKDADYMGGWKTAFKGNVIVGFDYPRWRLWFRDDSNGKAKHKLNDERLWT